MTIIIINYERTINYNLITDYMNIICDLRRLLINYNQRVHYRRNIKTLG